jgi:hypothetical protein
MPPTPQRTTPTVGPGRVSPTRAPSEEAKVTEDELPPDADVLLRQDALELADELDSMAERIAGRSPSVTIKLRRASSALRYAVRREQEGGTPGPV